MIPGFPAFQPAPRLRLLQALAPALQAAGMRELLVTLGLLFGLLSPARAQIGELFFTGQFYRFQLQDTVVAGFSMCTPELSPETTKIVLKPARARIGAAGMRTLFRPSGCPETEVASGAVAVDKDSVFWIGRNGNLYGLDRQDAAGTIPARRGQASVLAVGGIPPISLIAADSAFLYWNVRDTLFRASKRGPFASRTRIVPGKSGDLFHQLKVGANGAVFFLSGRVLYSVTYSKGEASSTRIASDVAAFNLTPSRVFWAEDSTGNRYFIRSRNLALADERTHYSGNGRTRQPDNIAADTAAVYWHAKSSLGGAAGPIFRKHFSGDSAEQITSYIAIADHAMESDGRFLFWMDYGSGIYRQEVNYPTVAPPDGNIWITGFEITQGIQVPGNKVPLLAHKPTALRVFVRGRHDSNGPWRDVTATLTVPGTGILRGSNRTGVSTSGSDPSRLEGSFLFFLGRALTGPGTRDFTVRLRGPWGRPESDTLDNVQTFRAAFRPERNYTVRVFTYGNSNNGDTSCAGCANGYIPPFSNFEAHRLYLQNVYPFSSVRIWPLPGSGSRLFDNNRAVYTAGDRDSALRSAYGVVGRLLESVPGNDPALILRPEQGMGGTVGWCCGFANGHYIPWSMDDRGQPGRIAAQEISHSYDGVFMNKHTWDSAFFYPRTDGVAGSANDGPIGPFNGVKFAPTLSLVPGQNADSTPAAWDYMSYSGPVNWVSPYTYCKMLKYGSGGAEFCPSDVEGGGASGPKTAALAQESGTKADGDGVDLLYLQGSIAHGGFESFGAFERLKGPASLVKYPAGKTHTVSFWNAEGQKLESHSFALPNLHTHHPGEKGEFTPPFGFYLPWPPGSVEVTVSMGQKEVLRRKASVHAPKVVFEAPAESAELKGRVQVAWKAEDADFTGGKGERLTYSLWYSRDEGKSWTALAANLRETSQVVDFEALPGGTKCLLRVLASDGLNTGEAVSAKPFSVPDQKPQIVVSGPDAKAKLEEGDNFLVTAAAFDWEDGPLDDKALVWKDEAGKVLGYGSWLAPELKAGPHTFTATATDAEGQSASGKVQVEILGEKVPTGIRPSFFAEAEKKAYPEHYGDAGRFEARSQRAALHLQLPYPQVVTVTAYDLKGKAVGLLWNGLLPTGRHMLSADGLPKGLYLCRIRAPSLNRTLRLTVMP